MSSQSGATCWLLRQLEAKIADDSVGRHQNVNAILRNVDTMQRRGVVTFRRILDLQSKIVDSPRSGNRYTLGLIDLVTVGSDVHNLAGGLNESHVATGNSSNGVAVRFAAGLVLISARHMHDVAHDSARRHDVAGVAVEETTPVLAWIKFAPQLMGQANKLGPKTSGGAGTSIAMCASTKLLTSASRDKSRCSFTSFGTGAGRRWRRRCPRLDRSNLAFKLCTVTFRH
jgi:hypothetical protein